MIFRISGISHYFNIMMYFLAFCILKGSQKSQSISFYHRHIRYLFQDYFLIAFLCLSLSLKFLLVFNISLVRLLITDYKSKESHWSSSHLIPDTFGGGCYILPKSVQGWVTHAHICSIWTLLLMRVLQKINPNLIFLIASDKPPYRQCKLDHEVNSRQF